MKRPNCKIYVECQRRTVLNATVSVEEMLETWTVFQVRELMKL